MKIKRSINTYILFFLNILTENNFRKQHNLITLLCNILHIIALSCYRYETHSCVYYDFNDQDL